MKTAKQVARDVKPIVKKVPKERKKPIAKRDKKG